MAIPLRRTTFTTSRVLEFFSEKELNMQLGHEPERWSEVIVNELVECPDWHVTVSERPQREERSAGDVL